MQIIELAISDMNQIIIDHNLNAYINARGDDLREIMAALTRLRLYDINEDNNSHLRTHSIIYDSFSAYSLRAGTLSLHAIRIITPDYIPRPSIVPIDTYGFFDRIQDINYNGTPDIIRRIAFRLD